MRCGVGLTYRPDGRLETETVNSDPTVSYSYDDAGQLTSAVDGVRDRSWAYGTRGNRVSSVDGGVATNYITNPNGSMAQATTGSKVVYYRYDDAGRRWYTSQRTSGAVTSQTLNGFTTAGQATDIQRIDTGGAATEETRVYDADGRVTYAYIGEAGATPKARDYLWDTTTAVPQIIEHRNHGALWFRSTWGNQRIGFKNGTAAPQWFEYDARGSVIRADPANTDVVNGPEAYTAFGEAEGFTGYDRFGYRGELTNSDRINLRARDYDPETGQFTSQDPLDGVNGTPAVANPYHYVDNDPLNGIDPLGLQRMSDAEACVQASLIMINGLNGWASGTTGCPGQSVACLLGANEDGSCFLGEIPRGIHGLPRMGWELERERRNAKVSLIGRAISDHYSGNCNKIEGLLIECLVKHPYRGNQVTIGNVILNRVGPMDDVRRSHEARHADQWALLGKWFALTYGALDVRLKGDPCANFFEIWADLSDGGYSQC